MEIKMQRKSKLLISLLLLSGALFGCGQTSEQPSESNSENIQNSETSPNLPTDDSSTSEIEDTQLLTVKQEALTSLDNYLDLSNYRQAQKEEIASIIAPQFPETDLDTITTIVKRYYDQDTWKADLIFEKESFDLLQNILDSAGELSKRAPYMDLVDTTFAKKALQ